jgi:hypothetical protein
MRIYISFLPVRLCIDAQRQSVIYKNAAAKIATTVCTFPHPYLHMVALYRVSGRGGGTVYTFMQGLNRALYFIWCLWVRSRLTSVTSLSVRNFAEEIVGRVAHTHMDQPETEREKPWENWYTHNGSAIYTTMRTIGGRGGGWPGPRHGNQPIEIYLYRGTIFHLNTVPGSGLEVQKRRRWHTVDRSHQRQQRQIPHHSYGRFRNYS